MTDGRRTSAIAARSRRVRSCVEWPATSGARARDAPAPAGAVERRERPVMPLERVVIVYAASHLSKVIGSRASRIEGCGLRVGGASRSSAPQTLRVGAGSLRVAGRTMRLGAGSMSNGGRLKFAAQRRGSRGPRRSGGWRGEDDRPVRGARETTRTASRPIRPAIPAGKRGSGVEPRPSPAEAAGPAGAVADRHRRPAWASGAPSKTLAEKRCRLGDRPGAVIFTTEAQSSDSIFLRASVVSFCSGWPTSPA